MANVKLKDPDSVLDYTNDWSDWLSGSEVISTSTWSVDTGITQDSESETNTTATIFVSGGSAGETYRLTNEIVTDQARTAERSVIVRVEER